MDTAFHEQPPYEYSYSALFIPVFLRNSLFSFLVSVCHFLLPPPTRGRGTGVLGHRDKDPRGFITPTSRSLITVSIRTQFLTP